MTDQEEKLLEPTEENIENCESESENENENESESGSKTESNINDG